MALSRHPLLLLHAVVALMLACSTAQAQSEPPTPGKSLLGASSRLELSCANVITSLTWWTRLGFLPVPAGHERPDSIMTLSDGQALVTLTKRSQPSPTLVFVHPDLRWVQDTLTALGTRVEASVTGPALQEIRLISPNGIHLAVRSPSHEPWRPVTGDSNQMCGKLTELSIGTSGDATDEILFWERLGFTVKREGRTPYHFTLLTDGSVTVGIHEQRDIPSLSMTYFAENMADRLDVLRASGFTLSSESITAEGRTGSAILTSPDGQRLMLFRGNQ